ncbi:MAG TPA: phosphoribosylanthranilate isomerase [Terriglobales bacterium]|nr:phosphoribosylanthranilate isomerase [Terriglobales bacterium]
MTWIKICGTTSLEDALLSVEAGADALGFIFAESPRRIEPERAREIIMELPARIEKVGVFVDPALDYVRKVAQLTGITRIQLYGDEQPGLLRAVEKNLPLRPITRAIGAGAHLRETLVALNGSGAMDSILLDSGSAAQRGGTGKVFDWKTAKEAIGQSGLNVRWIIAGGLKPENVGEAIRLFKPWGVDVVSGVESSPGKKDPGKLGKFVAAARAAAEEI